MNGINGRKVLLVDDQRSVRQAVALLFGVLGAEVEEADNAEAALRLFQPGKFDLVATDYKMPGMDGIELAQAIQSLAPGQKIIMISGYVDQLSAQGQAPGAIAALVHKPCSLAELAAALRALGFSGRDPASSGSA